MSSVCSATALARDRQQGRGRGHARRPAVPRSPRAARRHRPAESRRRSSPALHKALLIFHSPTDDTVGIDNASHIFTTAKHPKSFISLAGADHLISVLATPPMWRVISAWADRYLDMIVDAQPTDDTAPGTVMVRETRRGSFSRKSSPARIALLADEPVKAGGLDSGPGPYDLLLAALGACTSMTMRLYADNKQMPLTRTQVRLRHEQDLRQGLRRVRNQGRQDRPYRACRSRLRAT